MKYKKTKKKQLNIGHLGNVMVSMLDKQTFTSVFYSDWVPHSYSFVPHVSKKAE